MQSPLGQVILQADNSYPDNACLLGVWFDNGEVHQGRDFGQLNESAPILMQAESQLHDYFLGQRQVFSIPLATTIGTPFQRKVWQVLTTIPYGDTWNYQQLATAVGNPKAAQAVGQANGKNPISIIVPCHRVIGKNGQLVGYAGGLKVKEALLKLERAIA